MAKDAKGHGSDGKGKSAAKPSAKGMRLISTHTNGPHSAKVYNNPEWGEKVVQFFRNGAYQPKADYHTDDVSDAHATADSALARYASMDKPATSNSEAAQSLMSTLKSTQAPVHDGMVRQGGPTYGDKRDYPKQHVFVNGNYHSTTTWSRTGREAADRVAAKYGFDRSTVRSRKG